MQVNITSKSSCKYLLYYSVSTISIHRMGVRMCVCAAVAVATQIRIIIDGRWMGTRIQQIEYMLYQHLLKTQVVEEEVKWRKNSTNYAVCFPFECCSLFLHRTFDWSTPSTKYRPLHRALKYRKMMMTTTTHCAARLRLLGPIVIIIIFLIFLTKRMDWDGINELVAYRTGNSIPSLCNRYAFRISFFSCALHSAHTLTEYSLRTSSSLSCCYHASL